MSLSLLEGVVSSCIIKEKYIFSDNSVTAMIPISDQLA